MDTFNDNHRDPQSCLAVGLDCRTCVRRSAETIAVIAQGMTPRGARSTFVQLYPSPACAPMAAMFESAYLEAAAPRKPLVHAFAAA